MQQTGTHDGFTGPPPTLGTAPDDPSRTDRLPDGVQANCQVNGPQTHPQTVLHHAWCVERDGTLPAWLTEAILVETRAETEACPH